MWRWICLEDQKIASETRLLPEGEKEKLQQQ